MDMLLKIGGMALTTAILSIILKKVVPEFSFLLGIAFGVVMFFLLQTSFITLLEAMYSLASMAQIDALLLTPVVKTVAISIITKITGEFCRSAGEGGIATFVEFSGTVISLVIALPLIEGVMTMMADML